VRHLGIMSAIPAGRVAVACWGRRQAGKDTVNRAAAMWPRVADWLAQSPPTSPLGRFVGQQEGRATVGAFRNAVETVVALI